MERRAVRGVGGRGDRNGSRWDDDRGRATAAVDPASPDGIDHPDGCFRMPAVRSVGRVGG
jgi:hypothetical protein